MKQLILIIFFYSIGHSQVIDSIPLFKYKCQKEKSLFDYNVILNNLLKKEIANRKDILQLEKKLNIQFYNIETILMTYSFSETLKLTDNEKKGIENLFLSFSNGLIKEKYPSNISLNRDDNYIKPVSSTIGKKGELIYIYLIGFKKNEFINEHKVMSLLNIFNENTREKTGIN